MPAPKFQRPSTSSDFLRAQEQLEPDAQKMLATLVGKGGGEGRGEPAANGRSKEDRSHRTTLWLSPSVQRQIRLRAMEQGKTVSAYLLGLLAREGIADSSA